MPILDDLLDAPIDPQTGTSAYFNKDKQPSVDWSGMRHSITQNAPLRENVGLQFEPYGGVKNIDEKLSPNDLYDIPEGRAQNQSGFKLIGNAIGQFAVEASLGIPEAVGYTLDMEPLYNADQNATEGYDNFMSKYLRDTKENLQENLFPLYQSHKAQSGTFSERMTDPTFIASMGKTLGNTGALMAVGWAASALTGGIGGVMVGTVAASLASAKAEATMEAFQAFTQAKDYWDKNPELLKQSVAPYTNRLKEIENEYNQLNAVIFNPTQEAYAINNAQKQTRLQQLKSQYEEIQGYVNKDLDKLASYKSGQEASLVFKANATILLPSNFIEYATFMKPFAGIAKTLEMAKLTKVGRAVGIAINMGSEGIYEEGGQQAAQWEAANTIRNGTSFFGEGFGDRLSGYLKDPEMQTNIAVGSAMGLGFDIAGHVYKKVEGKIQARGALKAFTANLKDVDTFNKIDNSIEKDLIVKAVNTNQFDQLKERISAFSNDAQNDEKLGDDEKSEIKKKADKLIENATYVQDADAELVKTNKIYAENPNVRKSYVLTKFEDKKTSENIDELQRRLSKAESEANLGADPLTSNKNRVVIAQSKINTINELIYKVNSNSKLDTKTKTERVSQLNKTLEDAQKDREENLAQAIIKDPSFNPSKYTVSNISEIHLINTMLGGLQVNRDLIRQHLAEFETKTPEQTAKDEVRIEDEKKQNLINIQRDSFNAELSGIDSQEKLNDFTAKLDQSQLEPKDKTRLKKQALDIHNKITTRQKQQETNNSPEEPVIKRKPKLFGSNEIVSTGTTEPIIPPVRQPKLVGSNAMPTDVNTALANETHDQFSGELNVESSRIPKLVVSNDLVQPGQIQEEIVDPTTVVLNDELKTDEVVPVDDETLTVKLKDEELEVKRSEFDHTSTIVSVAHGDKKSEGGVDTYKDGKIELTEGVNEKLFDPNYANIGTKLSLSIDTEYNNDLDIEGSYNKNKDNIDKVPIKITNNDGDVIGYVHTIEWLEKQDNLDPQIKKRLIAETRAIRNNFYENNIINTNLSVKSIVTSKSPGWLNLNPMVEVNGKMVRQYNSIDSAFKHDNQWDDRVEIMSLTGVDAGNIDTVNDKMFKTLKGATVALIPGSNGQVITKVLKQLKLSKASEKVQKDFIHNILGIIYNASHGTVSRDELFTEIGKYLHATFKGGKDLNRVVYGGANKLNLLFNLDLFEGIDKNVTVSIRKPDTQLYDTYKVSKIDGKINIGKRVNVKSNQFVEIDPKAFEQILITTLGNKYLNLSKQDLKNPKQFTRLIVDNNYNVTRTEVGDYRDFISETGAATTSVHGIILKDGSITYTTQPTIGYDSNINKSISKNNSNNEIAKTKKIILDEFKNGIPGFTKRLREKLGEVNLTEIKSGVQYARVILSNNNDLSIDIVTGTDKKFTYTFASAYAGTGNTKNVEKDFPIFIHENGVESGYMVPESIGRFYQVSKDLITDIRPTIEEVVKPKPVEPTTVLESVRKSKITPKGKPSKLSSDDVQSLGEAELELSKTSISSFSLIPNVIQENELVGTLTNMYLAEFSQSKVASDIKDQSVLDSIKSDINDIYEDATNGIYYEDDAESNAQAAKYTKTLLDNFEPQYNEDGTVKFIGYKTKLRLELERLKFDPLEQEENDGTAEDVTTTQFIDNKSFKEDPEKSASSRVKRGLISIPLYEGGEIKTNLIGTEVYRDYYEVFNTLMEATSDLNINELKSEIQDLGADLTVRDGHPFNIYSQVSELLDNALVNKEDTFYNEFMSVFKKQRTKFIKPIIYSNAEGLPSINLYNSNKSGAAGVLFNKWGEGVKNSKLVAKIKEELSDNKGQSKSFTELKNRFNNAPNNFKIEDGSYYKEIADIFTSVGIEITPAAIEKMAITFSKNPNRLSDLEIRDNGKLLNKFTSVMDRSFMNVIGEFGKLDSLKQDDNEDSDGVENNIFRNQAKSISVLAKYETKVNPSVLSNSFRNGNGDVVYGFVNSHHLANTINDIKNDESKRRNIKNDKFAGFSTWLTDENLGEVELFYLDSATNGSSNKNAVAFEDMSALEKEQIKASLVLNKGSKKGYFMTPTPSDKTTFAIVSGVRIAIDKNTDLILDNKTVKLRGNGKLIDDLYDLFVRSEIHRIEETSRLVKDALDKKDLTGLIKGEHYDIRDGKVVLGSRGYFFLMPQMNEFFKDRLDNALSSDHFIIGENEINANGENIEVNAKKELANQLNRLHEIKSQQWSNLGMQNRIDNNYKQKVKNKITEEYFDSYTTMDYVINSMIGYANQYMLFTGDPASFAKADKSWNGSHDTWQSMVDGTVTNMFKRVAKDIAPGYEGLFEDSERNYNVLFIAEPERNSRLVSEYEGKLKDQIASTLTGIEFADAQEWTTMEEHVRVLAAIGRITKEQKDRILDKYKNSKDLTDAEIGLVLQPMKPVQVGRKYVDGNPVEYYIKTSSFPLIPQLTAGLQMDAIRIFMENNKIDRLTPKSAVKLGYYKAIQMIDKSGMVLLDEDGKLAPIGFNEGLNDQLSTNIHTLDRSFFRIQQDVPYHEDKNKIPEGSQMKKLKYSDLPFDWEFNLSTSEKPLHGSELKQLDDDIHTEIYKRNYEKLVKQLGGTVTRNGLAVLNDFGKLKELLIDEAKARGFDFNDLMLLNTVDGQIGIDGTPLFMHPALPKIESLLNSLIKNKVLVNKFPGKSYVQGSSMGFDYMLSGDRNVINEVGKKVGIKLLSSFTGELGYKMSEDNQSVVAQVLLPWYFAESMDAFINKTTGQIDESKIDPKLLELIGYRIPTQDHGSMIKLEVVGFLPKESGDLLIVPPELSKIMGSDFDVDKLFVHKFNYKAENGSLNKIIPRSNDVANLTDEELQNLSLDITSSILSHPGITERLLSPLDNTDVADVLTKIKELQQKKTNTLEMNPNKIDFSKVSNTSAMSDSLHSQFVDINAAGKTGVGIGSIASTSHVLSQYSGIYIKSFKIDKENRFNNAVRFAKTTEDRINGKSFDETNVNQQSVTTDMKYDNAVTKGLYRLDRIYGISGKRISQVIKNIQTEAVDNAKNQRLFGMNLNKSTFDTALFLAKAGLDEEYIGFFLNQPIIKDYVNELNNISDIGSTEFESNQKEKIQTKIWDKYKVAGKSLPILFESKIVSLEEMSSAISGKIDKAIQLDVLESFIAYSDISSKLSRIFRAINTDTKFLGKSLTSTIVKSDQFSKDFIKVKGFGNHENLSRTLQLSANKYGIDGSLSLYMDILPYDSDFFKNLRNRLELTSGKDLTEDMLDDLFAATKNSIWTTSWGNHVESLDIDIERKRLLFGTPKEQSLAIRLSEIKKSNSNTLVKFLNIKTSKIKNVPDVIEFPSAGNLEKDFSLKMQQSWLQLYNNNRPLALDLVSYVMINGNQRNARDFSRFIPIDILSKEGVLTSMNKTFNHIITKDESGEYSDVLFKQFIQHNPSRSISVDITGFDIYDSNGNKTKELSKSDYMIDIKNGLIKENRFVYFYDKTSRSVTLMEREGNKYNKIPLLGNKKALLTEYNLQDSSKNSIFVENKAIPVSKEIIIEPSISQVKQESTRDIAETYGYDTGVNVKYVLKKIIENGANGIHNEGLLELSKFLLENHGDLLNTINLVSVNDKSQFDSPKSRWGEINHSNNTIKINMNEIIPMDKGNKWGFPQSTSDEFFALVFAHELIHKITISKEKSPELIGLFNKFVSEYSGNNTMTKYTKDINEFLSGLFTDKNLQAKLNQVEVNGKSLFSKIWDAIIKMISGDIDVKPGSLLEKSMEEAIKLITPETKSAFDFKSAIQNGNVDITNEDILSTKEMEDLNSKWSDNESEILNKYPDFTKDIFDTMSDNEIQRLIDCL